MRNRVLTYFFVCFLLFLTMSCRQEECEREGKGTTLCFSVRTMYDATRGVEDLNDDGTVSELESIMQGRKMYRLGVFLVENGTTVASAVLEQDDERFSANNTAATLKFENLDYSKTYQLYAIANYANYGSFNANVHYYVTADNIIGDHCVGTYGDNICDAQTIYPLALKKEVKLAPGVNEFLVELKRTYARLRIIVRNQSNIKALTLTKLKFHDRFTKSWGYVFVEGGYADVSPKETSNSAIVPFEQGMVIPKVDVSAVASEKTIFDAYILESVGGNYEFTLGLSYVETITHEESIQIKALDNNGYNLPITAIQRNDFITILVNVSFNEKSGKAEFEVSNWNEVDGEVTFD